MRFIFLILFFLSAAWGMHLYSMSETVYQEIVALLFLLIGAVFFVGSSVTDELNSIREAVMDILEKRKSD